MKKKFICIICPNGCEIEVEYEGDSIIEVSGNLCDQGMEYVRGELFSPERGVTSLVSVRNGVLPLVSVKTSKPIPKDRIFDLMDAIADVEVDAPIKIGDVIVENILNTGVDLVATKNVDKR